MKFAYQSDPRQKSRHNGAEASLLGYSVHAMQHLLYYYEVTLQLMKPMSPLKAFSTWRGDNKYKLIKVLHYVMGKGKWKIVPFLNF